MKKLSIKPGPFLRFWDPKNPSFEGPPGIGALDGPGFFETVRVYGGKPAALGLHLERLARSGKSLGVRDLVPEGRLRRRLLEDLRRSGFREALLRIGCAVLNNGKPVFFTLIRPFGGYPAPWYQKGVFVGTSTAVFGARSADAFRIKSNDYRRGIEAYLDRPPSSARRRMVYETIFRTPEGVLTEGTISNLFIVRRKAVWTAPASCGILRGITRDLVLEASRGMGLEAREMCFLRHDLYTADEAFLTSAAAEVMPVVRADARVIGRGVVGPLAKALRGRYLELVKEAD